MALGNNHSKVVIIPKNQGKYLADPRFRNRLPDGRVYVTVGAGPSGKVPGALGQLVGELNRPRDVDLSHNTSDEALNLPEGVSEDDMIEKLFSADAAYKDDLTYALFPSYRAGSPEYNSNGYTNGILSAVGFSGYHRPPSTPGFDIPVPDYHFKKAVITVEECPNSECPK